MIEKPQSTYRLDIQGLRALAVLAVIINHFSKTLLPNGFLGVDIFFVISGFVITSLLNETAETPFRNFIINFYERRIKRLFPSLILSVVLTALVSMLFIAPWQNLYYGPAWHTGLASLAGLSNMYLLSLSVDYFGGSAELNPFTQTWSLGVEEQFYLLYPILFWSVNRFLNKPMLPVIMALLSAVSIFAFLRLSKHNPPAAFYLMPARFWELGFGCVAFFVTSQKMSQYFSSACLLCLLGAIIFMGQWPLAATFAVALLTVGILVSPSSNALSKKLLANPVAVYLGAISYPLYLWHWSVLSISRWTIGVDQWTAPIQLALIFALAAATHKWLETPLKKTEWAPTKFRAILNGLAILAAAMMLISLVGTQLKGHLYSGVEGRAGAATPMSQEFSSAIAKAEAAERQCNITPDHLPTRNADIAFFENCLASQKRKIILVGDSFSNTIAPHIAMIAARFGYDYKTVLGYGCAFSLSMEGTFAAKTNCHVDLNLLRQKIFENVHAGDLVVFRLRLAKPQYVKFNRLAVETGNEELLNIYDRPIAAFRANVEAKGGSFLVVGPNLTQEFSSTCLNHQWFNTRLSRVCDLGIAYNSSLENQLSVAFDRHLESRLGERSFFSVLNRMCDDQTKTCKTSEKGSYLYDDDSHLNLEAIDLLAPDLELAVRALIPNQ